jgi:hypothetical protein
MVTMTTLSEFLAGDWGKALSALGGGLLSLNSANRSAGMLTDAARASSDTTMAMYNQSRADLAPWRETGMGALASLRNAMTPGNQTNALNDDPGYRFRVDQGQQGVNGTAAMRSGMFTPRTNAAVSEYGRNYATAEYPLMTNRLSAMAGLGQTSANTLTDLAFGRNGAAGRLAANEIGAGNARASGYVGGADAIGGTLSSYLRSLQEQPAADAMIELLKRRLNGTA